MARVTTTPEAGEAVTAESLGWQLRSALPPLRLHSVSLYSNEADCLWLSEGALGPDEHNVVVEGIEALNADKTQLYYELGMEDGRIAIFLSIRAPRGDLVGTVMILADMKSLSDGTMERIVTAQVKAILQKIAVYLRKQNPQSGDTSVAVVMPASAALSLRAPPAPVATVTAVVSGKNSAPAARSLAPRQVEEILTLELEASPPPPVERPAAPPAKAAPSGKGSAKPAPVAVSKGPANRAAPPAKAAPAASAGRPAPAAAPAPAPAPLPEIEVLAFDPSISIPTARAAFAPAALPDVEVLPFEPANFFIPTVRAAPVAAPAAPDIEVLDFDRELTLPPQPVAAVAAISSRQAKAASPAPTASAAPAAKPASPAKDSAKAKAEPAPTSTSRTLTPEPTATAAKVASNGSALLINDTGKLPKLEAFDETTAIEPALSVSPPQEPLSAADTAADLTLHVQELIKLRSSGRTRRYEVLARSRRDAGRNEVPAAFVAESAKGREGSALDALVVERLLQWLGEHGETIWDSEPASFSVNLSIGALEDEHFPEKIAQWLESAQVPAEYVGFEITEFACVQCRPQVQRFIEACEKLGCFLVIDNFSLDSSVFEFLGSKALRHVKIDPKLTAAAMKDKLPQALVVAILQACKVLGVHCVAKRIDSQSTLQWLTAVGCDFAQGFALEKPSPLESLVTGKPIPALRNS